MRLLTALLIAVTLACPAYAQLHERGMARTGATIGTTMGGTALMCRLSCSQRGGCSGWSWTRAGVDGPQSRCEMLGGGLQSRPDSCCESGQAAGLGGPAVAAGPVFGENRYAGRSTTPGGPPVSLVGDPTGGIWDESEEEAEESGESDSDARMAAEDEDDARFAAQADAEAPTASNGAPAARIVAGRPRTGGPPRYSVQREYGAGAAPAAPVEQPAGMANPTRWIDG